MAHSDTNGAVLSGSDSVPARPTLHERNLRALQQIAESRKLAKANSDVTAASEEAKRARLARMVLGDAWERLQRRAQDRRHTTDGVSQATAAADMDSSTAEGSANAMPEQRHGLKQTLQRSRSSNNSKSLAVAKLPPLRAHSQARAGQQAAGAADAPASLRRTASHGTTAKQQQAHVAPQRTPSASAATAASSVGTEIDAVAAVPRFGSPMRCLSLFEQARQQQQSQQALQQQVGVLSEAQLQYLMWRQKQHIPEGVKVFCMAGTGHHSEGIRAGLLARGWRENPDHNSRCFDLKWAVKCSDIDHAALWPGQVVNHFSHAACITTKVGLCHSMRLLHWHHSADCRGFFARSYDLKDAGDEAQFLLDFKWTAAEGVIKRALQQHSAQTDSSTWTQAAGQYHSQDSAKDTDAGIYGSSSHIVTSSGGQGVSCSSNKVGVQELRAAMQVTLTRLQQGRLTADGTPEPQQYQHHQHDSTNEQHQHQHPHQQQHSCPPTPTTCLQEHHSPDGLATMGWSQLLAVAGAALEVLQQQCPQTHINGSGSVWIVKPAGKSRGRGIRLFDDARALLQYVGEEAAKGDAQWVAQKYIERPLLIHGRKFDIRQWVLVTSWNPLQVWFYRDCYLRFSAQPYDPDTLDIFTHLTNNSISKHCESADAEDAITAAGNMWAAHEFKEWLATQHGSSAAWDETIQPAMKQVVEATLRTGQDMVRARKGSCQLYGFDFLIDDTLNVWLLEVNSSPTMEASTPVTEKMCAAVQEDILKVLLDVPQQKQAPASPSKHSSQTMAETGSPASQPAGALDAHAGDGEASSAETHAVLLPAMSGAASSATADTGAFECIVSGGLEVAKPLFLGVTLELKGTAIANPHAVASPRVNLVPSCYQPPPAKLAIVSPRKAAASAAAKNSPQHTGHTAVTPKKQLPAKHLQKPAALKHASDSAGQQGNADEALQPDSTTGSSGRAVSSASTTTTRSGSSSSRGCSSEGPRDRRSSYGMASTWGTPDISRAQSIHMEAAVAASPAASMSTCGLSRSGSIVGPWVDADSGAAPATPKQQTDCVANAVCLLPSIVESKKPQLPSHQQHPKQRPPKEQAQQPPVQQQQTQPAQHVASRGSSAAAAMSPPASRQPSRDACMKDGRCPAAQRAAGISSNTEQPSKQQPAQQRKLPQLRRRTADDASARSPGAAGAKLQHSLSSKSDHRSQPDTATDVATLGQSFAAAGSSLSASLKLVSAPTSALAVKVQTKQQKLQVNAGLSVNGFQTVRQPQPQPALQRQQNQRPTQQQQLLQEKQQPTASGHMLPAAKQPGRRHSPGNAHAVELHQQQQQQQQQLVNSPAVEPAVTVKASCYMPVGSPGPHMPPISASPQRYQGQDTDQYDAALGSCASALALAGMPDTCTDDTSRRSVGMDGLAPCSPGQLRPLHASSPKVGPAWSHGSVLAKQDARASLATDTASPKCSLSAAHMAALGADMQPLCRAVVSGSPDVDAVRGQLQRRQGCSFVRGTAMHASLPASILAANLAELQASRASVQDSCLLRMSWMAHAKRSVDGQTALP